MACLRQRKRCAQIDKEIGFQVAHGDLPGVHDELAAAENPRAGGNEGGAELYEDVEDEEEIGDGAEEGDGDAQAEVGGEAGGAGDRGEVEVERVDEEGDEAGDEEDVVPVGHNVAVWGQDLVPP